jgi:hypothetical protein
MNYSFTFLIFILAAINISAEGDFNTLTAPKLFSIDQLIPYTDSTNTPKLKFKSKEKTHFTFPLQAGFEFGRGNVNHQYGLDYFTEWNAFLDMNLYNKEIFLTIEAADALVEKDWTVRPGYLSIGARFRVLNENHHNIFLHAGMLPALYGIPGGYTLTVKYMYALNDFIGLSVCGRYSDWMYKNESGFSVYGGIQIITN